jgi:hypothetical protein
MKLRFARLSLAGVTELTGFQSFSNRPGGSTLCLALYEFLNDLGDESLAFKTADDCT